MGRGSALGRSYVRREPDKSLLHKVVRENLETFLAQVRSGDPEQRGLPKYVEKVQRPRLLPPPSRPGGTRREGLQRAARGRPTLRRRRRRAAERYVRGADQMRKVHGIEVLQCPAAACARSGQVTEREKIRETPERLGLGSEPASGSRPHSRLRPPCSRRVNGGRTNCATTSLLSSSCSSAGGARHRPAPSRAGGTWMASPSQANAAVMASDLRR